VFYKFVLLTISNINIFVSFLLMWGACGGVKLLTNGYQEAKRKKRELGF
jgi:hypothetical protein